MWSHALLVTAAVVTVGALGAGLARAEDGAAVDTRDDPPIAVVVLVEGHELFFDHRVPIFCPVGEPPLPPGVEPRAGVRPHVAEALGQAGDVGPGPATISRAGGPGSRGALLVYGDGVDVRQPMGDLRELTADKLGDGARQEGVFARDLLAGLRAAKEILAGEAIDRKLLFVIGDGVDPSATAEQLRAVAAELAARGIEVHPLSYAPASEEIGDPRAVAQAGMANLKALGRARMAKDGRELTKAIAEALDHLHRYAVADREAEVVRVTALAALTPRAGAPAGRTWWWLAIPGGLVALTAVGLWYRRRAAV